MLRLARKFGASLRAHGIAPTAAATWDYAAYWYRRHRENAIDRKYGTDTGGVIQLEELTIDSSNAEHGVHFEPVRRHAFELLLEAARIQAERFTFVDLGCGKGRALLFAAEHPFRHIVGVEFSSELAVVARDNIRRFLAKTGAVNRFELHHDDAANYVFPATPTVLFLYNPFRAPVLSSVVANLTSSFQHEPRPIVVLYWTPDHAELFDALEFLTPVAADDSYRVYRSHVIAAGPEAM